MSSNAHVLKTPIGSPTKIYSDETRGRSPITRARLRTISQCPSPSKSPGRFANFKRIRTPIKAKLVSKESAKAALFTLAEDYLMIQKIRYNATSSSLKIAGLLEDVLKRPKHEIKDRISKTLRKLSKKQWETIKRAAKVFSGLRVEKPSWVCEVCEGSEGEADLGQDCEETWVESCARRKRYSDRKEGFEDKKCDPV